MNVGKKKKPIIAETANMSNWVAYSASQSPGLRVAWINSLCRLS
ncbi:hypothetical protein QNN00_13735 [Bacillus velezensis]|nr:hypothetical protein [Bacillus velezensis]